MIIQDEETRRGVEPETTVADLCMDALQNMVTREQDSERFTVLHKGCIYFFDITCVGVKPPYEMYEPPEGDDGIYWCGQRRN